MHLWLTVCPNLHRLGLYSVYTHNAERLIFALELTKISIYLCTSVHMMYPLISDFYACVYSDVHLNQDLHENLQNIQM